MADLTLGDFWGIGEETPYPNAAAELKKGLSLILVHTDKGQALLNACAPALVTAVRTPAEAVKKNHQLRNPAPDSPAARRFHNLYGKKGAAYAIAHCNEKNRRTLRLRRAIRQCPPLLALCRKIPKLRDKL